MILEMGDEFVQEWTQKRAAMLLRRRPGWSRESAGRKRPVEWVEWVEGAAWAGPQWWWAFGPYRGL